tara:strand:+ start:66 stop:1181 length:1116 start_codon:yes stop_codon:yes gene_type:complete
MKKLSLFIFLVFLFCNLFNVTYAKGDGEGELNLSKTVVEAFIKYIRKDDGTNPDAFFVTLDGKQFTNWWCNKGQTCSSNIILDIKDCEKHTGKKCKRFAKKRIIKWKNSINPGKGRISKINKKLSDEQIYEKLAELGFINLDKITKEVADYDSETIKSFKKRLKKNGNTGFVLRWHDEKPSYEFQLVIPKNSPPIISDYKSIYGVRGGSRKEFNDLFRNQHAGIDFYIKKSGSILSAADGKVLFAKQYKCEGNIITIKHSDTLYSNYMHVGKFNIKKGDYVKRGQVIAQALVQTSSLSKKFPCIAGLAHLHFTISDEGPCNNCTGSWKYMGKDTSWRNPHNYWTGGKGKPECFIEGKEYPKKKLTLPVECI